ncbi:MAG: epoxyqueuosine reductase QueH [bacterium]
MKILVHVCCGPCFVYPYQALSEDGHEIFGFFFNPNIHPYQEYQRRLETVRNWSKEQGIRMIYRDEYRLEDFLRGVVYRESERCLFCYHTRLEAAAQTAARGKFDCFTTTLLYSKFQKHETITRIGHEVGHQYGVQFYYQDFREGWKEGISLSKTWGLYRQQYCGCIYSEKDRYWRHQTMKMSES